MDKNAFWAGLGTFIAVSSLVFIILYFLFLYRSLPSTRLERVFGPAAGSQEETPRGIPFQSLLTKLSGYLQPLKVTRRMEETLQKADLPLKGSEFLALNMLAAALGWFALRFLAGGDGIQGLLGAGIGLILPQLYVRRKQGERLARFNTQIPDALILTANSLRAGYSFLQAMEITSREMQPPISREFSRALKEMNLGMPTEEALEAMAARVASEDFDLVITAVLIQRQVGGNLARILETIAETIRQRIRIKGEIQTLTAQGRISGLIISILPIGLSLVMLGLNPAYIKSLVIHPLGLIMVTLAVGGQLLGAFLIKKIVDIEV
ncbi:MAG: type II secretion system F family protein [Limnochordia bacterium]|jgi:tight adherence protein B